MPWLFFLKVYSQDLTSAVAMPRVNRQIRSALFFTHASPAPTVAAAAALRQHILIGDLISKHLPPYGLDKQPVDHQGDYADESDD
jgi:hypothetical protein